MKKTCIIHNVSTRDPRSFYKQARSLAKAGFDTSIIGLYECDNNSTGVRLLAVREPRNRMWRFFITNYQVFVRAFREKADIYHFHDLDFVPWAVLLKIITGAKVIYDIHEAYPEYMLIKPYIPKLFRRILSVLVYVMEHSAAKLFDAIVPNDNYVSQDFSHKNSVTVFNFPTIDFFDNTNGIPWREREFDLFYHGSLPRYHFETMMEIAARLNEEHVRNVWGIVTNDTATSEWARNELRRRKLASNFIFMPYIDYLNVSAYLSRARIGIIPLPPYKKFFKNIPLKMFEFMGSGLPVVLSDLPPSRQFIDGENCAIAVEPDNIEKYVEAIKLLLNNPEKAIEMGNNGKHLVFERFNWLKEEEKLISLYSDLT